MDVMLVSALQNQFNFERYSAEIYAAMSAGFDSLNLTGMSAYMHKRAEEERGHALKFQNYMVDRDIQPYLDLIPAPAMPETGSIFEAGRKLFALALAHERQVTARINALYEVANKVVDPATCVFLHWFISEQVEEEKTLSEILTRFELAGDNGAALLLMDRELGG